MTRKRLPGLQCVLCALVTLLLIVFLPSLQCYLQYYQ